MISTLTALEAFNSMLGRHDGVLLPRKQYGSFSVELALAFAGAYGSLEVERRPRASEQGSNLSRAFYPAKVYANPAF